MIEPKVSNNEAKLITDQIFNLIENLDLNKNASKQIEYIFEKFPFLINKKPNIAKFPRLKFNINSNDVENLKQINLIDEDNKINFTHFDTSNLSPLEKILYSILWKQGDLGKERHIISGILNSSQTDDGLVFYYFGRHLQNNKENPIVDQHVIRAFRIKECCNIEKIDYIRSKDYGISKKDSKAKKNVIENYLTWHKLIRSKHNINEQEDLTYNLDLLFFALGKYLKI